MTDLSEEYPEARVSRTARYRKVTKPLLERRRRARINRCLEELKDLMVGALEVERENINKLEKADILELTVRHLSKLKGPRDVKADAEKFQAGFGHCAAEAYHFILSTPGVDQNIIQQLVKHLSAQLNEKPIIPVQPPIVSPAPSASSVSSGHSAHSPSYPIDYQRSSPLSSPQDVRVRSQQSYREESPSVPVEYSLTCDVSTYNTHDVVRRPGEPATGLLMTVNDARTMPNYIPEISQPYQPSSRSEYRTTSADFRERSTVDPNAERKHIILKKIREHIMERQHREPDSTTSTKNELTIQQHREAAKRNRIHYENTLQSSELTEVSRLETNKNDKRSNTIEEAVNLSNNNKKNETIDNCKKNLESKTVVSSSQNSAKNSKRSYADYKSIHPKKVFIRAPNISNSVDELVKSRMDNSHDESRQIREPSRAGNGADIDRGKQYGEGFQRYKNHFFNLEKEEYYMVPNPDQDDMWRPW